MSFILTNNLYFEFSEHFIEKTNFRNILLSTSQIRYLFVKADGRILFSNKKPLLPLLVKWTVSWCRLVDFVNTYFSFVFATDWIFIKMNLTDKQIQTKGSYRWIHEPKCNKYINLWSFWTYWLLMCLQRFYEINKTISNYLHWRI